MTVNLIVLAVTVLMAGFLFVWLAFPRVRPWMEAPKYRVLEWDRRWPAAERSTAD
ncbi:MAG TPA: hypothetical protein VH120_00920 [Gemmataceae bacterium]|nr:hypothetical protein [Gemmataceae bacterium]